MAGYKWHPWIKMVPYDGATETIDLTVDLTDLGGPTQHTVSYSPQFDSAEDVNRALRPVMFGYRPTVSMRMLVFTMSDQEQLQKILNWLMDPSLQAVNDYDAGVFLSLDDEQTYRRVVLDSYTGPNPIAGKTCIGSEFVLGLRCVDLISEVPFMDPDTGTSVARW